MKIEFNHLIQQILDAKTADLTGNKDIIDQLVCLLCKVTNIDLHPPMFFDEDATITQKGKAVSMTTAAQCAEEYMRTQVFLRGVHQAIQDQLSQHKSISILYAGTGPFGLLVLPLLHTFSPDQVQVTLIDIHQESLDKVKKIISTLEISEYIHAIKCEDLLNKSIEDSPTYDLLISETMKAMLDQEPQVSIFSHLIPLLKPTGSLIPQSININAYLSAASSKGLDDLSIGQVFSLNRSSSEKLNQMATDLLSGSLNIPEHSPDYTDLKFTTDIQVYKSHCLSENQSSLNLPKIVINANVKPNSDLTFDYIIKDYPHFSFNWVSKNYTSIEDIPIAGDTTETGIPYLKRSWAKRQMCKQKNTQDIANLIEQEYALDELLFSSFNIPMCNAVKLLFNAHSITDIEQEIISGLSEKELNLSINTVHKLMSDHTVHLDTI